jgi:hypothetical protein
MLSLNTQSVTSDSTATVETFADFSAMTLENQFDVAVEAIAHHEQTLYIKQLLLGLCYYTWETDSYRLATLDTRDLVLSLYNVAPSLDDLQQFLSAAIEELSLTTEYIWAADALTELMWPVYSAQAYPQPITPQSIPQTLSEPEVPALETTPESEAEPTLPVVSPGINWFDIRLDLMKYANPLKMKLLLFSALERPFSFSPWDWSDLRTQTLSSLLKRAALQWQTVEALEHHLLAVVPQISAATEDYSQVVGIMTQVLQPIYPVLTETVRTEQRLEAV